MDLFGDLSGDIVQRAEALFRELDSLPLDVRIETINSIKQTLHRHSPFAAEPVDCVIWVKGDRVAPNDYNPNAVAPPEMRLLERSIRFDHYTQPVVTHQVSEPERDYEVIDGYHRTRVGKECKAIRERLHGYLPITVVGDHRISLRDRMAATIRHNRARGVHGVLPMVDIVASLIREGWTDAEICKELGMDPDEVLRFKQNSGLPELFKNNDYSKAWE